MTRHTSVGGLATGVLCVSACLMGEDWPEWRGPGRNGVVNRSPSLVSAFPEGGPKQVWLNTDVPGAGTAGWGSVVVAKGRAYVFLNWKSRVPIATRTLREQNLKNLGWTPERPPADLLEKIETARLSKDREALKEWPAVREWLTKWIEANLSEEQRRWRGFASDRLSGGARALPFETIDKLATIKDKEFGTQAELDAWFTEQKIDGDLRRNVMRHIPDFTEVAKDVILCLDATNGKPVWRKEYAGVPHGQPCSCTPCVADGRCFVLGSNANVYCVNAETGEEIWTSKTKQNPSAADGSSFAVVDGVAVLLSGPVTGYDVKTGEVLWSEPKVRANHNSAALWRNGGKNYLVCNTERDASCLEPKTGRILWTVPGGGWSTATIQDDTMVIFSQHKNVGLSAYRLSLEKPEKRWTVDFVDRGASPVIHDGHVYAIGGHQNAHGMCIQLDTGEVKWDEKLPGGVFEISSPVVADGKVVAIVGTSLHLLKATPERYTLLGKANLKIETCTSPALVDGKVYLRLGNAIACYDLTGI